jgi:glycine cleavage system H protein
MSEICYSKAHAWAKTEGEEIILGLTEYAVEHMGDIIFVELPEIGASLTAGKSYGSVESAKAVEDMIAPVTGTVARVNDELVDVPETMNEDPYEAGWTVAVSAAGAELGEMLDEAAYNAFVASLG